MNDDFNPERPLNLPEDPLARALRELIQNRSRLAGVPSPQAPAHGPCPDPVEWPLLLGADPDPSPSQDPQKSARIAALLAHAAVCRACAGRLRALAAVASLEESLDLAGLASSSHGWQHRLAAELARTPHRPARGRVERAYLWAGAGLAASLLLVAGLTAWWQRANSPEKLLAEAYTHSRTFDLRIPGAAFAPVTPQDHLRGSATDRESSRLLDARARIERHIESSPKNPRWLELQARAYLLDEQFDPAIGILDRLLAAGPVTSSLLLDDASAYFQRGTASGS
jgi:hypothetical protein